MPRFFVDSVSGESACVVGDDARHIALSLRMKAGEKITLCSGGTDYLCTVESITPEQVVCAVDSSEPCAAEPNVRLHLFQALPKGDKAELILQKAVELGVHDVTFMLTERCVSRPDSRGFEKKLVRYSRIAVEAAKQSGRGILPEVRGLLSLEQAAEAAASCDSVVWCYEKGGVPLSEIGLKAGSDIALLIGCEGGFSDGEAELFKGRGFMPVGLGRRILRCETAPIAAASVIMYLTGNLE